MKKQTVETVKAGNSVVTIQALDNRYRVINSRFKRSPLFMYILGVCEYLYSRRLVDDDNSESLLASCFAQCTIIDQVLSVLFGEGYHFAYCPNSYGLESDEKSGEFLFVVRILPDNSRELYIDGEIIKSVPIGGRCVSFPPSDN